jgi:nicotinamide mononucleotide transporter
MFDYFFAQYQSYSTLFIVLELTAIFFGLWSVWSAKKDSIWVFPTGLVSTSIYAYLLWQWDLLGDSMINGYYFIMSIYGWYHWTRKKEGEVEFPISTMNRREKWISVIIFALTVLFVVIIYIFFNKFTTWAAYVDTFITGIFFVGMWLMAKRKIENWILWIVGDFISIPLYFSKGYAFTGFQFVIFTIVAIYGFLEWKKTLNNSLQTGKRL